MIINWNSMVFADRLVKKRNDTGFTQESLAEKTGISAESIQKWESGNRANGPHTSNLLKLAAVLNVNIAWLADDMRIPRSTFVPQKADNSGPKAIPAPVPIPVACPEELAERYMNSDPLRQEAIARLADYILSDAVHLEADEHCIRIRETDDTM